MTNVVHRLSAYNSARGSDNPLHKDDAAKALGYSGGLVPGVDMYAYLAYAPVRAWGEQWLESGSANVKLLKPVYEGEACEVCVVSEAPESLDAELRCGDSLRATAKFTRRVENSPGTAPPERPMPQARPRADEVSLAVGVVLGSLRKTLSSADAKGYLNDMREDQALYLERGIVHPGFLLRMCNLAVSQNVVFGPWIHTESQIQHHAIARLDEELQTRAVILKNFEKSGHRWFELEVHLLGDKARQLCTVKHTAIYEPRKTKETQS